MTGTRTTNRPSLRLHPALRRAWAVDRALTLLGVVTITVFAATLGGLLLDHRAIMGEPAWLKPAKFALSISVYSFTLVWLLGCVVGHRRLVRTIAQVTAVTLGAELAIIVLQVVRGATSHFNDTTPVDAALWATMGGLILGAWFANALAALLLLRQRFTNQAVAWSLRWGLLLSLVGMLVAVPMVISGGHTIGAADGGPGLPLVGARLPATCGWRISSACTASRFCHWWVGPWPGGRRCALPISRRWCTPPRAPTSR